MTRGAKRDGGRALAVALAEVVLGVGVVLAASGAWAKPTPAQKCEATKNKVAGNYYLCREKAQAKGISKGQVPDFSKCEAKFDDKWDEAESKGGGACPDNVATSEMNAWIAGQATQTAAIVAGAGIPVCGDNAVNVAGEQCDGADLGGESCVSLGFSGGVLGCDGSCAFDTGGCTCGGGGGGGAFPASGQTTSYGAGSDGDVQAGAALSYTDNGDGTITDNNTGLMWEKKSDDGSIHDWDNEYTWGMISSPYTMNGTMVTVFLAALNTPPCFAGYCDWRIPNVKELQSIVDYELAYPEPSVNAAFNNGCAPGCTVTTCSCTRTSYYWSSTTSRYDQRYAWDVDFWNGVVGNRYKDDGIYVRAVRGGL